MRPKVELNSDFHESYDHEFDKGETDFIWHRLSVDTSRKAALDVLRQMGLHVPYYDRIENMYALLGAFSPLIVVYTDPFAHRGEGKELTHISLEALQNHHNKTAMLYVKQPGPAGKGTMVSYRYLRMGTRKMWLRYESKDDVWRSNCGDVEITEISRPPTMQSAFHGESEPHPAVAIDFVSSIGGRWFTIDYNMSPGIDHTPFTEKYSATEIVDSVKEWFRDNAHRLGNGQGCPNS